MKSVYREVRLTENQWTSVLLGLDTAIESLVIDYENTKAEVNSYARVHNKIAEQIGRKHRV